MSPSVSEVLHSAYTFVETISSNGKGWMRRDAVLKLQRLRDLSLRGFSLLLKVRDEER